MVMVGGPVSGSDSGFVAQQFAGEGDPLEGLAGKHVLLAEDEAVLSIEIELALEDAGAVVVGPIARLHDGLALAATAPLAIDAAILDIDLQGEDVYPLADVLCEQGIPFVFHTGHGSRQELKERFDSAPVCLKPAMTDEILRSVARLLD